MTKPNLPKGARERPDGRFEQRVMLGGRRVSIYAKTVPELKANVEAATQRHAQGRMLRANETVEAHLTRWLADVIKPHREYRTWVGHHTNVVHHFIPALGTIRLADLGVSDVRSFINHYLTLTDERGNRRYAPGTINQMRATPHTHWRS